MPQASDRDEALEQTRRELEDALTDLRGALHETLEWRKWVTRHPFASLTAAAAFGFFLSRR